MSLFLKLNTRNPNTQFGLINKYEEYEDSSARNGKNIDQIKRRRIEIAIEMLALKQRKHIGGQNWITSVKWPRTQKRIRKSSLDT